MYKARMYKKFNSCNLFERLKKGSRHTIHSRFQFSCFEWVRTSLSQPLGFRIVGLRALAFNETTSEYNVIPGKTLEIARSHCCNRMVSAYEVFDGELILSNAHIVEPYRISISLQMSMVSLRTYTIQGTPLDFLKVQRSP